jgi:hypothetical protein
VVVKEQGTTTELLFVCQEWQISDMKSHKKRKYFKDLWDINVHGDLGILKSI